MYIKTLAEECPGTPFGVDGPDGPMSVCLTGGAAPTPCQGWVLAILAMLALRAVRGSGCSAPGFAAFDTLPPDFASRAGLQDALRLQPAPTIAPQRRGPNLVCFLVSLC